MVISVATETLAGHQRAIMSSMTVNDIYKDRKTFSKRVFEMASTDLANMGFIIISYTIKDLRDEHGYLEVRNILFVVTWHSAILHGR
jgi:flotillin